MAKRKLVTAGKYTPARLTDNEEFALLELEEKLKERKARKTQLSMYLPSVLDQVKAALIISMPMEEIKALRRPHPSYYDSSEEIQS